MVAFSEKVLSLNRECFDTSRSQISTEIND